ncbi:MAG: Lrp/AsnC ligand binding domain-containing protein [Bacteroidales bacterium]|nr:Lrp/AsnC ligand binding domain-containing protein [Bacteroidales bacterium]MBR5671260.1 Lrp/AsnC ligand binding domain-containing protein [Bacteroidales bacterium]
MISHQLDPTDRRILSFLIKNARLPYLEIARECGISGAAIHQRVHKMEQMGIITGSRLLVKPQALGLNVCAFIGVSLSRANAYSQVIAALEQISEIVECHFITGNHALMLKIYCKDNDHLMHVLIDTIQNIDGVERTETWISLEEAIERQVSINDTRVVRSKSPAAKKDPRKKISK